MAVLPKKRTTGKDFVPKPQDVFAVRVGDRCFGHADHIAALVDLAPVHPTVRASERAEVILSPSTSIAARPFTSVPNANR